jgi:hypothetical protein
MPETVRRPTWVRESDRYPDATAVDSFIAMDGETEVGVVKFMATGIDAGSWMWSMLLTHPGPAFRRPTNGLTPTRKEAAHDLVKCWHKFRAYYGIED